MIKFCVRLVQRWLPEPFIFAILLTFVAALVAMPLCHQTPLEVVEHWGDGVWNLLEFAMQMALVLVCGSTLAAAPVIKRAIDAMARLPKSAPAAIALVTVVSALACCINWGFGLIVGVVFAKAIARKRSDVDYRLLIASAYSGFVVWHAGISGSIPLTMATPGEALTMATDGALTEPVPLTQTIFDWHNLVTVLFVIIGITVANTLMHPKRGALTVDPALLKDDDNITTNVSSSADKTPAQRLENSKLLSWLVALMLVVYLVIHLGVNGASLDIGGVIMIFLALGLVLHSTPLAYVRAFGKATTGAAGIILQFPFYAGIMGIVTGVGVSGISLGGEMAEACIRISNPITYPLLTFLCAAVLNMFVPSGGGHWAVQAPVMFTAGASLAVDPGLTGMAIAWGDAWTNLIQPFWALPALAIARLDAKDIMGYCLIDLLVTGVIICAGLLVWAM
ncbi:MAG: short-chain fatty acid transporter [Muribaculaceae bacterium]|nr:short-chain fatty acid transporter [Muribaculaceae bacterium]